MSSSDLTLARNELYAGMDNDKPHASYIKTILGKVAVTVWDNFLDKPVDVVLHGDPRRKDSDCIVNVWSEKENAFFKRANVRHFNKGVLISYQVPEAKVQERGVEQSSDEELSAMLKLKFLAFQQKINNIESIAVLYRILNLAQESDRLKYASHVEKRISELQVTEFPARMEVEVHPRED